MSGQLLDQAPFPRKNKNRYPWPLPGNELCFFVFQPMSHTENETWNSPRSAASEGKVLQWSKTSRNIKHNEQINWIMWHWNFTRQYIWRLLSCRIWRRVAREMVIKIFKEILPSFSVLPKYWCLSTKLQYTTFEKCHIETF